MEIINFASLFILFILFFLTVLIGFIMGALYERNKDCYNKESDDNTEDNIDIDNIKRNFKLVNKPK